MKEPSNVAKNFKHGIYRHFKGGIYQTLFVAKNSEKPDEELIVYKSVETGEIWARPLKMFIENIDRENYNGPRFILINENEF